MGDQIVKSIKGEGRRMDFVRHLLNDIRALELMLERGLIEDDIIRIGAEQEFCLVDENWRPSDRALTILAAVDDEHFTTELAKYNLEINLDPLELKGDCFSRMQSQLTELLDKGKSHALKNQAKVLLSGILPTISKNELNLDYMTPTERYKMLNEMMMEIRGGDFSLHIRGVDELSIRHDSVLFEACNTSFQAHLQITPQDFVSSYNWAQAISGPVLGIASNSPLLLGRELWHETRIALFQQSLDTRSSSYALQDQLPRVAFGSNWLTGSPVNIFKDNIAQYKVILAKAIEQNSLDVLASGHIPKLDALSMHNGTIYKWNRPCFGVGNGKPHLRIENRYLPSGPTVLDEMANFVFWVGLMKGRPKEFDDLPNAMDFRAVKDNFIRAARTGRASVLGWKEQYLSIRELTDKELLPIAYEGLHKMGVDKEDIERYLAVIDARNKGYTASQWQIRNYRKLRSVMKQDDALITLTKAMYENQQSGQPVSEWPMLEKYEKAYEKASRISHIMSTQLFTVNENDLAQLAQQIMSWKGIHHVPVEDDSRQICGLLTWTQMQGFEAENVDLTQCKVSDIMIKDFITTSPETEIKDAVNLIRRHKIGSLLVVHKRQLLGIVTLNDLMEFSHDQGVYKGIEPFSGD